MNFVILYKGQTTKGSNYYKLYVELSSGIWEEAVYFGNTTPKRISAVKLDSTGNYYKVEIQKHTSRDKQTGKFKCSRKVFINNLARKPSDL